MVNFHWTKRGPYKRTRVYMFGAMMLQQPHVRMGMKMNRETRQDDNSFHMSYSAKRLPAMANEHKRNKQRAQGVKTRRAQAARKLPSGLTLPGFSPLTE